jgi:hypothetical protein
MPFRELQVPLSSELRATATLLDRIAAASDRGSNAGANSEGQIFLEASAIRADALLLLLLLLLRRRRLRLDLLRLAYAPSRALDARRRC